MKRQIQKYIIVAGLIIFFAMPLRVDAQCAMCKASAETSIEGGSKVASTLNKGILYLFVTPYLIVGTIGFFWWRANKKAQQELN